MSKMLDKNILNTKVAHNELVVGVKGNLCYITFWENEKTKKKLNSSKSWKAWSNNASNPILLQNGFVKGYKISGINGRNSSNALNSDNLLVEHPILKLSFEIGLDNLIEIMKVSTITKGVINIPLLIDNRRRLITKKEYDARVKEIYETEKRVNDKKRGPNRVRKNELVAGTPYTNIKDGKIILFIGTLTNQKGEVKYVFSEGSFSRLDGYSTEPYATVRDFYLSTGDYGEPYKAMSILPNLTIYRNGESRYDIFTLRILKTPMPLQHVDSTNTSLYESYTNNEMDKIKEIVHQSLPSGYEDWELDLKTEVKT